MMQDEIKTSFEQDDDFLPKFLFPHQDDIMAFGSGVVEEFLIFRQ